MEVESIENSIQENAEETAYERLLRQVNEKKRKLANEVNELNEQVNKKKKVAKNAWESNIVVSMDASQLEIEVEPETSVNDTHTARYQEDDNYVDMSVDGQLTDFVSEEEPEEGELFEDSQNNSTTIMKVTQGHCSSSSAKHSTENTLLGRSDAKANPCGAVAFEEEVTGDSPDDLKQSFQLLQNFLVKKGLMSPQELAEFRKNNGENSRQAEKESRETHRKTDKNRTRDGKEISKENSKRGGTGKSLNVQPGDTLSSNSEVTLYTRAVPVMEKNSLAVVVMDTNDNTAWNHNPGVQIDSFLNKMRLVTASPGQRKISSSSDEVMDTSDECEVNTLDNVFVEKDKAVAGHSDDSGYRMAPTPKKTPEQHAEAVICDAE